MVQTNSIWVHLTLTFFFSVFIIFRVYTSKTEALRDFSDALVEMQQNNYEQNFSERTSKIIHEITKEKAKIRKIGNRGERAGYLSEIDELKAEIENLATRAKFCMERPDFDNEVVHELVENEISTSEDTNDKEVIESN